MVYLEYGIFCGFLKVGQSRSSLEQELGVELVSLKPMEGVGDAWIKMGALLGGERMLGGGQLVCTMNMQHKLLGVPVMKRMEGCELDYRHEQIKVL